MGSRFKRRLKNYSARLGGFLTSKVFKNLKSVCFKASIMALIFIMVVVVMISGDLIKPKQVEAQIETVWLITYIATALAASGAIYLNRQAIVDTAKKFWEWCTLDRRTVIEAEAEVAAVTGVADIPDQTFQDAKNFLNEKFDENKYPQTIVTYYDITSPWGTVYHTNNIGQPGSTLTSSQYNSMFKYSSIYWEASGSQLSYRAPNQYQYPAFLQRNGVDVSNYLICYFDNNNNDRTYFNSAALSFYYVYQVTPVFAFYYNETTKLWYPTVLVWDGGYYHSYYMTNGDTPIYIARNIETVNIDAVYDPVIARDEDYDFIIDGHRYVFMPKDISELIGRTVAEVLAGDFADLKEQEESIALGVEALTLENQGVDVINGSISTTIIKDLDIPESEFELPSLPIIATKFPFCIPFDLYFAVANLVAEPVAPEFNINFPASIFGGSADMDLDFGVFEGLAVVVRWTILLGFVISLILLTRKLIRG